MFNTEYFNNRIIFIHENIVENTNEIRNKYEMYYYQISIINTKYQLTKHSNILNQTSILCKQSIISDNKYNYIIVQLHKNIW